MLCYFCRNKLDQHFGASARFLICSACDVRLKPQLVSLPDYPTIEYGLAFYTYSDHIRDMIRDIKFNGNWILSNEFNQRVSRIPLPSIFFESDCMVTVPSHWLRQLWRGKPHIPLMFDSFLDRRENYRTGYLKRNAYSSASYKLGRYDRVKAMGQGRFLWNGPNSISSITIIDDICTTGATIIEIGRLLKSVGVKTIRVLVAAYVDQ